MPQGPTSTCIRSSSFIPSFDGQVPKSSDSTRPHWGSRSLLRQEIAWPLSRPHSMPAVIMISYTYKALCFLKLVFNLCMFHPNNLFGEKTWEDHSILLSLDHPTHPSLHWARPPRGCHRGSAAACAAKSAAAAVAGLAGWSKRRGRRRGKRRPAWAEHESCFLVNFAGWKKNRWLWYYSCFFRLEKAVGYISLYDFPFFPLWSFLWYLIQLVFLWIVQVGV